MSEHILQNVSISPVETPNYRFYENTDGDKIILFKRVFENKGGYGIGDSISYIDGYASKVKSLSVDSVLVTGLGSGLIPYYLSSRCTTIDVIEINQELIDLVINQNYLPRNVNIICADALTYDPPIDKQWDCIIIDSFFGYENNISFLASKYETKYIPKLSKGGFLYIPFCYQKTYYSR